MLSTRMKQDVVLPPEVWRSIVDCVIAMYLDQAWVPAPILNKGAQTEKNLRSKGDSGSEPNPVISLLHLSFEIRHITLKSLSRFLGIACDDTGVGRLETDPRVLIDAVRRLWTITNGAVLKTEAARLAEQSSTLGAYAHLVVCFQHFRSLLIMVGEQRDDDGSLDTEQTAEQFMNTGGVLRQSTTEHLALALSAAKQSPVDVHGAFLVRHGPVAEMLVALALAVFTEHTFTAARWQVATQLGILPDDVLHQGRSFEEIATALRVTLYNFWALFYNLERRSDAPQLLMEFDIVIGRLNFEVLYNLFIYNVALKASGNVYRNLRILAHRCMDIVDERLSAFYVTDLDA